MRSRFRGVRELRPWRPWTIDGAQMMGGYVVELPGDFAYLTVRGGGHMVPEYKPAAALAFITAFIRGTAYLEYQRPMNGLIAGRSNSLSQVSTWTDRTVPPVEELGWLYNEDFQTLFDDAESQQQDTGVSLVTTTILIVVAFMCGAAAHASLSKMKSRLQAQTVASDTELAPLKGTEE